MNNEQREKIFLERFKTLPEKIQRAITDSNWLEKLRMILTSNRILLDQAAYVESVVFDIMIGIAHPDHLLEAMMQEGISKETAEKIIKDVEIRIFAPIKSDLVASFEEFESSEISTLDSEDQSLDLLLGKNTNPQNPVPVQTQNQTENLESREDILKEIEDPEESLTPMQLNKTPEVIEVPIVIPENNIAIEKAPEVTVPTEQTPVPNPIPTPKPNAFAEKLNSNITNQAQSVKIDPYREAI